MANVLQFPAQGRDTHARRDTGATADVLPFPMPWQRFSHPDVRAFARRLSPMSAHEIVLLERVAADVERMDSDGLGQYAEYLRELVTSNLSRDALRGWLATVGESA